MPGWRLTAILSSDGQRVLHEHGFDAPLRRVVVALGRPTLRRSHVRNGLSAGGRWIRTFGSARYLMAVRGRLLEAYSRSFRIRP